jgi:tetratricopeptide (TPR) repeat protein
MSSEDEDKSKRVRRYTRLAIIAAFLLALFWPLGNFFFWIFFGAGSYFAFLAFYYRPRNERREERYESRRSAWQQPDKPGPINIKMSPKNIKLIIVLISFSVFLFMIVLMIIGFATGDDAPSQNLEDMAISESKNVLSSDPTNLDALTNLGNTFYASGQYDSALVYYDKVLDIDPQNSSGLYNKGLTFYSKQDYSKSMELLRQCITLHPDNQDAYIIMGDNHYAQNQFTQALTWYKQAYDKGARNSGLLNIMAYLYDQQNQRPEAIRLYKEALQQDSSLVDVYNRLAELEPNHADWYKNKAEAWK